MTLHRQLALRMFRITVVYIFTYWVEVAKHITPTGGGVSHQGFRTTSIRELGSEIHTVDAHRMRIGVSSHFGNLAGLLPGFVLIAI